ncbi:M48 family metallopeptidase [Streptomyces odonnellii]|uniref:hypothetical protein n=1 Tax=Streptomyces odonnellii TaxID=1417980 RepID=UPI000626C4ED|nr:hypothetical protein [Streptomyces odonnellii]
MSRNAASGAGVPQAVPPPPWLWLVMATYVYDAPAAVTWWREQIQDLWTDRTYPLYVSGDAFTTLRVMLVSQAIPILFTVAGVAAVLLPHLRGRYTEWRYHLVAPVSGPANSALHDIQRLLDAHAPGTVLTVSMRGRGPSIRVYARGWRGRRVAVSLGFLALWKRDPDRARALLLHEVAHLASGEHLITGLGSPFTGLVGAWPVVFLVCAVAPVVWLVLSQTFPEPSLMTGQMLAIVARLPQLLIVPVIALWCAELAADRYAVAAVGPRTVLEALDATKASGPRRVTGKLYHPPRALRRWFIERADRPVAPLLLLLAGPIALLLHAAAVTVLAVPSLILNDYAPLTAVATSLDMAHIHLLRWPRWAGVTAVVLLWPLLARPWLRLWGGPSSTSAPTAVPGTAIGPDRPARADGLVPYPRRARLLAALLPAAVLLVGLLPSTGVVARDPLLRPDTAAVGAER